MANIKIAQLTAKTTLADTDLVIVESATQTMKMTVATLKNLLGINSGGVVDLGSNANGKYTKFADGTMICQLNSVESALAITTATGALFKSPDLTWTFPAPFYEPPSVSIISNTSAVKTSFSGGRSLSSNLNCLYFILCTETFTGDTRIARMAIGRWKA